MIMAVEGDTDVRMMLKGNDEHGYVYVCNKESVVPRVRKNVRERRAQEEEVVANGARLRWKKRWKAQEETMQCNGKLPQEVFNAQCSNVW